MNHACDSNNLSKNLHNWCKMLPLLCIMKYLLQMHFVFKGNYFHWKSSPFLSTRLCFLIYFFISNARYLTFAAIWNVKVALYSYFNWGAIWRCEVSWDQKHKTVSDILWSVHCEFYITLLLPVTFVCPVENEFVVSVQFPVDRSLFPNMLLQLRISLWVDGPCKLSSSVAPKGSSSW